MPDTSPTPSTAAPSVWETGGTRVLEIDATGALLGSERSAIDLISECYGQEIDLIAIPLARLAPDFLTLRSGVAGNFLQKFIQYGYRVAIIGDFDNAIRASNALRDFIYESNKGGRVLFVTSFDELRRRL